MYGSILGDLEGTPCEFDGSDKTKNILRQYIGGRGGIVGNIELV